MELLWINGSRNLLLSQPTFLLFSWVIFVGWILSVCFHEFGHALVAYWGGDTSVKEKGYLTLNPLRYTHPVFSIIIPILFLLVGGIPLPGAAVYIDQSLLKNRFWKSFVALAGPLASGIFAGVLALSFSTGLLWVSPLSQWTFLPPALAFLIFLDVYVLLLNLLPIPPLDGYAIIEPWLSLRLQNQLRMSSGVSLLILFFVLTSVSQLNYFLSTTALKLTTSLGVPVEVTQLGMFFFSSRPVVGLLVVFLFLGLVFYLFRSVKSLRDIWVNTLDILAFFCLQLKRPDWALLLFNKVLEIQPNAYEVVWMNRGNALSQLGRYEEALACFDYIIENHPNDQERDGDQGIAQCWMSRGNCLFQLKRYQEAIVSYQETLKLKPHQINAGLLKGICHGYLDEFPEAIVCYDQVLKWQFSHPSAWSLKGDMLRKLKLYDEAMGAYEMALKLRPNAPDICCDYAFLLRDLNRKEEALTLYDKILKSHPNYEHAQIGKGWLLIQLKRYDEVLTFVTPLVNRGVKVVEFLNIKGTALSYLHRDQEAITTYNYAIKLGADQPITWYNKACHFAQRGNMAQVISCLEEAIKLNASWVKTNLMTDGDFDVIRDHPQFQSLLKNL